RQTLIIQGLPENGQRGEVRLERWRRITQECAADDRNGRITLRHEAVVELAERKRRSLLFAEVFAQLEDLQLAQRVVEVGGVRGTALGFDIGDPGRLETFFDEKFARLIEGEFAAMHLEASDEAGIAEQGVLQLAETNEARFAQVLGAGAGLRVALIE